MHRYPFSAVVGSDDLVLALVLTTVSPAVGGVLVRGEKGTAKSTAVRGLAGLLPPVAVVEGCRFSCDPLDPDPACPDGPHLPQATPAERPARLVELPVGATEDRLVGSLHLQRALADGVAELEPGLLAAAHRGLLYVDEVNLLHDHLVDLLLDAAAMGRSTVERDGVSVAHASRFVLVGTMNPEEGELRPQLLDRFGLTVEVAAPRDPGHRVEVVRRRLAYEADPAGFAARYADDERALAERLAKAQALLPAVRLGDDALAKIAEVCAAFEVDGMRADIVTARTAQAHAAWSGRSEVTRADVRAAARLAIPHRRRRNPFDSPGLDEDLLDEILGDDPPPDDDPAHPDSDPDPDHDPDHDPGSDPDGPGGPDGRSDGRSDGGSDGSGPDSGPDGADDRQPGPADPPGEQAGDRTHDRAAEEGAEQHDEEPREAGGTPRSSVAAPGSAFRTRLFQVKGAGSGEAGRRSRATTSSGRTVGARPLDQGRRGGAVHLRATLRAAVTRTAADPAREAAGHPLTSRPGSRGRLEVLPQDLRVAVREGREANLVLLCVDASGSMAARKRMEQVKAAVLSLLLDAYQRRDKVGLVTFRGHEAELVLPPTGSVDVAAARLRDLPAGGRTPLAEGLLRAAETLRVERLKDPRRRPLLVVVTDGRATAGPDALARSLRAADHLASQRVAGVVVDCETGRFRMGLAAALAHRLGAEHVPVGEVSAQAVTETVRHARGDRTRGRAA